MPDCTHDTPRSRNDRRFVVRLIVACLALALGGAVVVGSVEAAARGPLCVNGLIGIRIPSVMSSADA